MMRSGTLTTAGVSSFCIIFALCLLSVASTAILDILMCMMLLITCSGAGTGLEGGSRRLLDAGYSVVPKTMSKLLPVPQS